MNNTRASIIIPTFNRSGYLVEAINSALAQTIPCEVIVCDHGSTDDTPEVMKQYGDRIKYIRREKDFGVHYCWVEAVINATNEWVHFNYDDDWLAPDCIEKCLSIATEKTAFVMTQVNLFHEKSGTIELGVMGNNVERGYNAGRKGKRLLLNGVVSPGCILIRKKDVLNGVLIGDVPLATAEYKGVGPDILMSLLALLRYPGFGYIDEPLAFFRAHEGSITTDSTRDKERQAKILAAYDQSREYFALLRIIDALGIKSIFFKLYKLYNRVINKLLK